MKRRATYIVLTGIVFLFFERKGYTQYEEGSPLEFSAGLKTIIGDITYAKTFYYNTASNGFGLQPSIRADLNLLLFRIHDNDIRINLMGQTGVFQYFKAKKFDYIGVEPFTGDSVHYISKNPTYLPFYIGFYSPYSFMVGFEMFYYKGLGVEDLYGFKLLSIGYNARKFRIGAAWELYGQVRNRTNPTSENFLSFEFHWKIKKNNE
jgi:hypothetical protein